MNVLLVRGQTRPDQVDALARVWEEVVPARLRDTPGFRQAYFVGNREQNTVVGVLVWELIPDQARIQGNIQAVMERARDLMTGPPTVEQYEVLVAD
jgi:hypothetical protein